MKQSTFKNENDSALLHEGPVPYITFPLLERTGTVKHGFSTRLGGVSGSVYASMNLDFRCDEPADNIFENYRRITAAMGISMDDLVLSDQTHTTNIRRVTSDDRGKGFALPRDYTDVDGMITDDPEVVLTGLFADCVPIFFADPVRRAAALSHAGWRGTAEKIADKTVAAMTEAFGSRPEDIYCAIGPSICKSCYEVSSDVAKIFRNAFPGEAGKNSRIITPKENEKFLIDLKEANVLTLTEAGVPRGHIAVTGLCTCCQSSLLWSHRASGGRHGEMAGFIQVTEPD